MAKIKLGNRPKNFKRVVKFQDIDGESAIECLYKYRTRKEYGKFVDDLMATVRAKIEADAAAEPAEFSFSLAEQMERKTKQNAAFVMSILDGWNLDEELNEANVQQLAEESPAAVNAIMEQYAAAITEGRSGN